MHFNIPEQELKLQKEPLKLNNNSYKYLILIKEDGFTSINKFILTHKTVKKLNFYLEQKYEIQLNSFYNRFYNDLNKIFTFKIEDLKSEFNLLFESEKSSFILNTNYIINNDIPTKNEDNDTDSDDLLLNDENVSGDKKKLKINRTIIQQKDNYRKYIELSFSQFIFQNTHIQFEQIQKLCFLYIIKYKYNNSEYFNPDIIYLMENYKLLLISIKDPQYIDRIRILLSFTNNRIFDVEYKSKNFMTYLINLNNNLDNCSYLRNAYKILYEILDHLDESSSFFIAISQLNSYIDYCYYTKEKMYMGSLLTINDIKLDFVKKNLGFFFINRMENLKT